jgi:ankyrin repeat protein
MDANMVHKLFVLGICAAGLAFGADASIADAAMSGNREAVLALVRQKADVNAPQGDGTTALHWAAFHDDVEMVKALLAAGANPKATTREGAITPLSMACTNGSAAAIEALLKGGADAGEKNANGTTALMTAASSGSVDALRVLLAHGADIQAKESAHGQTALMFAAALDRTAAVTFLLEHGAQPNLASTSRAVERVRLDQDGNIVEDRPAAGGRGGRPMSAAQLDKADEAADAAKAEDARKAALEATASDLEVLGRSMGFLGAAVALAKPKARAGDVSARAPRRVGPEQVGGMTALLYAAREGYIETAKALLAGGADINQVSADKFSPLVMAIANGHLDLAKYLVDRGADPNLAATSGLTALYGVIDVQWAPHAWFPQPTTEQEKTPYLELMKDLLEHGANVNPPVGEKLWFRSYTNDYTWVDPAGATAFWRAAQSSDIAAMHLLVDHGADPKLATKSGDTPLMAAAGIGWAANWSVNAPYNFTEAVKYCVELGNDVNAVDNRGYTALHGAAYLGKNDMVEYLVQKGAKVDAKSKAGDSPADMANGPTRFGQPHPETVALLEKLGSPNSHNCRSDQCVVQAGSSIYNRVLTAGEQAEKDTLDRLAAAIGLQEAEYLPEGPARRPNGSR